MHITYINNVESKSISRLYHTLKKYVGHIYSQILYIQSKSKFFISTVVLYFAGTSIIVILGARFQMGWLYGQDISKKLHIIQNFYVNVNIRDFWLLLTDIMKINKAMHENGFNC